MTINAIHMDFVDKVKGFLFGVYTVGERNGFYQTVNAEVISGAYRG